MESGEGVRRARKFMFLTLFLALIAVAPPRALAGEIEGLKGTAFERAFYSTMIPYHEAGVAMSRLVLGRTRDPRIKEWAEKIVAAQTPEIERMRVAVEKHGGVERRFYDAARSDMSRMTQRVVTDRDFLSQMTLHHELAAGTARLAPGRTEDPPLLKLAGEIAERLSEEAGAFEAWP